MNEKEARILETFGQALPHMTETEKDRLLAFGEGMALMARKNREPQAPIQQSRPSV